MRAFKFLRPGATGMFSGVTWPEAGTWLEAPAFETGVCRSGVHACTPAQLPLWMAEELWTIELRDPVRFTPAKVVARAGRLLVRVDRWDAEAASAFAADCTQRVRALAARRADDRLAAYAADAEAYCLADPATPGRPRAAALAGMIAAHAFHTAGGLMSARDERARQSAWLTAQLGLPTHA